MNQCPSGPWVFHWCRFKFCWKFEVIFTVSTIPAISCSPVSRTLVISSCHRFSADTSKKFITGDKDTGDKYIKHHRWAIIAMPVTMTPAINLLLVTTTQVSNYCWCHWCWWLINVSVSTASCSILMWRQRSIFSAKLQAACLRTRMPWRWEAA